MAYWPLCNLNISFPVVSQDRGTISEGRPVFKSFYSKPESPYATLRLNLLSLYLLLSQTSQGIAPCALRIFWAASPLREAFKSNPGREEDYMLIFYTFALYHVTLNLIKRRCFQLHLCWNFEELFCFPGTSVWLHPDLKVCSTITLIQTSSPLNIWNILWIFAQTDLQYNW